MSSATRELWLQITAGQGPVECAWAVVKILDEIQREAADASITCKTIEIKPGSQLEVPRIPLWSLFPAANNWSNSPQAGPARYSGLPAVRFVRNRGQRALAREHRWRAHQDLERGNPVRVFRSAGA